MGQVLSRLALWLSSCDTLLNYYCKGSRGPSTTVSGRWVGRLKPQSGDHQLQFRLEQQIISCQVLGFYNEQFKWVCGAGSCHSRHWGWLKYWTRFKCQCKEIE